VYAYVSPGLTLKNSTFCPQRILMGVIWISEPITTIS